MRLQVGQRVLHFVLERKLGEGGFGEVWLARAGRAATALKFVSVAGGDRDRGGKEYRRINMMIETGAFNHDRLIKLHGAWLLDENGEEIPDGVLESAVHARTMELPDQMVEPDTLLVQMDLGQESLAAMLKRIRKGLPEESPGGIPVEDLLRFIHEAAEGIDYLNTPRTGFDGQTRQAVYHCDIKPENLLLADGKVRICDYGVARIEGERKTKSPNALSLAHASPELVEDKPCGQSDQYSLAVTYAQLRTGHLPFKSEVLNGSWRTVMRAVAAGELDLSGLEPAERAVIKKATQLNPKKRYSSATEMAEELAKAVANPDDRRAIPWRKIASIAVAASLIGASVYFGPELLKYVKPPVVVPNTRFQQAQEKFRQDVQSDNFNLVDFDELSDLASKEGQELTEADYKALEDGTAKKLQQRFAVLDEAPSDPLKSEAMAEHQRDRERITRYLQGEQRETLLNRFRLLEARQKLRVEWPDPNSPPASALTLFTEENAALANGRPEEVPGLEEEDQPNLLALCALNKIPQDASKLAFTEIVPAFADALKSQPSPAEKARLDAYAATIKAAVAQHITASGLDEAITKHRASWKALSIDPVGLGRDAAKQLLQEKKLKDADAQFASLEKYIQGAPGTNAEQATAQIDWCRAIIALQTGQAEAALKTLSERFKLVPAEELDQLPNVLYGHFAKSLSTFNGKQDLAKAELALLNQAIALCDLIEHSKKMTDGMAIARDRLHAQRMLVRLLLPEGQGNDMKAWLADAEQVSKAAAPPNSSPEKPTEPGLAESIALCLAEYKVTQSKTAVKGAAKISGKEVASLPGYAKYVAAIVEDDLAAAASALAELYGGDETSASKVRVPGLDWPQRKSRAASILVNAATGSGTSDPNDLSVEPFTAASAADCLKYLDLAQKLGGDGAGANASSPALVAKYFITPTSPPPSLLPDIETRLKADPNHKDPHSTWLLLISARLHQAEGEHVSAVKRFAEAFQRYDDWIAKSSASGTRDVAKEARLRQEPLASADVVFNAMGSDAPSELSATLATIYAGASKAMARQAIAYEDNSDRVAIAISFKRADQLAPDVDTLRVEGEWLKFFHAGNLDDDWRRLRAIAEELPSEELLTKWLNAYVLYVGYKLRPDPIDRRDDLKRAIKLYGDLLSSVPAMDKANPRWFIERGDSFLQLAYVAHFSRAELQETDATVLDYLRKADKDGESAELGQPLDSPLRVEALNLRGNATEDMSFYEVDVANGLWEKHYKDAIRYFDHAYDARQTAPLAAFNSGRCSFRLRLAQRRNSPPDALKTAARDDRELATAMNSMTTALRNWGETENSKVAEAWYWRSRCEEEAGMLLEADKSLEHAVRISERVDDPTWQDYQLAWARMALLEWRAAALANDVDATISFNKSGTDRALKLLDQCRANILDQIKSKSPQQVEIAKTLPPPSANRRVESVVVARACSIVIELYPNVKEAIAEVTEKLIPERFNGTDRLNSDCRAELYLALARRIMNPQQNDIASRSTELTEQAADFARKVLDETNNPASKKAQALNRLQSYRILSEVVRKSGNSGLGDPEKIDVLKASREHLLIGLKEVPDAQKMPPALLLERQKCIYALANLTGQSRPLLESQKRGREYRALAAETLTYVNEIIPHLQALAVESLIDGKPVAERVKFFEKAKTQLEAAAK